MEWGALVRAQDGKLRISDVAHCMNSASLGMWVCRGNNTRALVFLLQNGVDCTGWAEDACKYNLPRMVEILLAGRAPMGDAMRFALDWGSPHCLRVLVANGVRAPPEMAAFKRAVLNCRAATAALLRAKRKAALHCWDKFLLAEIAVQVWATRYDEESWETLENPMRCLVQ